MDLFDEKKACTYALGNNDVLLNTNSVEIIILDCDIKLTWLLGCPSSMGDPKPLKYQLESGADDGNDGYLCVQRQGQVLLRGLH